MIPVTKVSVTRAEGMTWECVTREARSIDEATDILRAWSVSAPDPEKNEGGYDKCDFTITFADGETYSGRFDLKARLAGEGSLSQHVVQFMSFLTGLNRPAHMTEERYQSVVKLYNEQENVLAFLAKYDVGQRVLGHVAEIAADDRATADGRLFAAAHAREAIRTNDKPKLVFAYTADGHPANEGDDPSIFVTAERRYAA